MLPMAMRPHARLTIGTRACFFQITINYLLISGGSGAKRLKNKGTQNFRLRALQRYKNRLKGIKKEWRIKRHFISQLTLRAREKIKVKHKISNFPPRGNETKN